MRKYKIKISILFLSFIFLSCSPNVYEKIYPSLVDGKYDSEFPYSSSSEQLEDIGESVKLLNTLAFYTSYIFEPESEVRLSQLTDDNLENKASRITYFNNSTSGTATIISSQNGAVALLTCAHIVDFPDTVLSYYRYDDGMPSSFLESISFKTRQSNYIADFPEGGEVEIIIKDTRLDVAIVGKQFRSNYPLTMPIFNYPIGEAKELVWGTFVYVYGYPMNYKMITKGIVSSPNKDRSGSFLIDAVFNRGFSGGIVLAIRDGVPNFELVGLVRAVPADYEYLIRPSELGISVGFNPIIPYNGDLFVEKKANIKYGITRVISIESIIEFIKSKREELVDKGYYLLNYF